jgi:hypothetical protein
MYRSFMKERSWMYELARRHDGAFGWASGMNVNYGTTGHNGGRAWGNYVPLVYTIPRENKPGKKQDMSKERLRTHASMAILTRLSEPSVTDDELLMYANHPDYTGHGTASGKIAQHGREHLIVGLLKSKDARARLAGVKALSGAQKGVAATGERLTDESIELLGGMISDPEEAWWIVMEALKTLSLAPADKVAPYVDAIAKWMEHEDWWLRHAALTAAKPIASDKRFYKKILPIIGEMVRDNSRAVALSPMYGIVAGLQEADPEVQKFAVSVLAQAYSQYPTQFSAPGGQDMSACVDYMIKGVARNLANTPGGFDKLYEVSRKRYPGQALPHKDLYMGADATKFGPKVKEALKPIFMDTLIPEYVGGMERNDKVSDILRAEAASEKFSSRPKMPGLVALYNRLGVSEYDWHDFGPDLSEIEWEYHSYDPKEEKIWEPGWRYRKVTDPAGMENWSKPEFDAKKAGWKKGNAPFGQLDGKIPEEHWGTCGQGFCRCGDKLNTLWEKEVILMRTKLKLPKLKEGHIYRLVVGGMSHVNGGDGFDIYVNGKPFLKRTSGVGKRAGGRAVGVQLTKDKWAEFDGEVTIAARGFCPIPGGKRSPGVQRQHFSVFLQEMKAPPITDEMIKKGNAIHAEKAAAKVE